MRRIIALLLAAILSITGCASSSTGTGTTDKEKQTEQVNNVAETSTELQSNNTDNSKAEETEETDSSEEDSPQDEEIVDKEANFDSLNDPELLQYVEDSVYAGLADHFDSEDYVIENVETSYVSKEYLDELAYNSQSNIWFGFTSAELDQQFQGDKYIFTLGDNNETVVTTYDNCEDDTYERVIKNVAIGTGVILVCVTVSVVSGGVGAAPVCAVFTASAKTGTILALSSGGISTVAATTITAIKTGDMEEAVKAGLLEGSESFKWGAIIGSLAVGVSEASNLRKLKRAADTAEKVADIADDFPKWKQAEKRALQLYDGRNQVSFFQGAEVPTGTSGATRPDIVRTVGDHLEAIEVKYYDLENPASRSVLYKVLKREIGSRVTNLPENATQRIVLDVTDRGFSQKMVDKVVETITAELMEIYPNIPIDVVGSVI
ncbi:MAG: hypothetical protein Q4D71_09310 [Oscillospiraceae bacterium]|nr:hypothetical protein [Oscillospiraceae bacterium]